MKSNQPTTGPVSAPTESDNLCKRLAELYPEQFAQWLFGVRGVTVEKTELSREPIRADAVILAQQDAATLHIEFQTKHHSDVPLPLRMLDYYVGLKRQNPQQRVRQALLLLKPTKTTIPAHYTDVHTVHSYQVVKLWELDPTELMPYEGLLPLATLCRTVSGEQLLRAVAERVQDIAEPQEQRETLAACRVLAGLRYNKRLVNQLLRENDMVEESVIYQDILRRGVTRGKQEGKQEGLQEGKQEGLQEGLQRERKLVLRLLERAVGTVPLRARRQIEQLGFDQLETLGETLFELKSSKELSAWLKQHAARL